MAGSDIPAIPPVVSADTTEKRKPPRSLLFLCGRNSIRSPMAEALARRALPPTTFITSAGVKPGEPDPFVEAVLNEENLSLGDRLPQDFEELEDTYFEVIITLSPEAHHNALRLGEFLIHGQGSDVVGLSSDIEDLIQKEVAICATS